MSLKKTLLEAPFIRLGSSHSLTSLREHISLHFKVGKISLSIQVHISNLLNLPVCQFVSLHVCFVVVVPVLVVIYGLLCIQIGISGIFCNGGQEKDRGRFALGVGNK